MNMKFDPDNDIVKLCAEGMAKEMEGKPDEAAELFERAWQQATSNFEKFTAAHYVARQQKTVKEKLHWDLTALELAGTLGEDMVQVFPSLYLNVAKCYEDLNDPVNSHDNYRRASLYSQYLPEDEYSNMIRFGISNGLKRVKI
jgi:hypothetical protein